MSGKTPTLTTKELLANIQREFQSQKVFAVNCSISAGVLPISKGIPVRVVAPKPLAATSKNFQAQVPSLVRSGSLVEVPGITVQPLADTSVPIQKVPCFGLDELQAKSIQTKVSSPETHTPKGMSIPVYIVQWDTHITAPSIHGQVDTLQVSVKTDEKSEKIAKISFPLTVMKYLSLQQFIHYRAVTLKKTAKRNHEIEFLGVCQIIPPVALQFDSIKSSEDRSYVVGLPCGASGPLLENQVWVIYRLMGSDEILALTIKPGD